jgi:DNA mismatch repair ATPase MutS
MVRIKDITSIDQGFRFMVDSLEIQSAPGRRLLLNTAFCFNPSQLHDYFDHIEQCQHLINSASCTQLQQIQAKLSQVNDIERTLTNLANATTLDDVELFEIKQFSLLALDVNELLVEAKYSLPLDIPDLTDAFRILDPENQRIPYFYIYPAYDTELAHLRRKMELKSPEDKEEWAELFARCTEKEDQIRQQLSQQLMEHASSLLLAFNALAQLDILLAKTLLALKFNLCKPKIDSTSTAYVGLINPWVQGLLATESKEFQALSIELKAAPCLITGANMGGKTVLLKTLATAQYLFQFGFYIPAQHAQIMPVEELVCSMGDQQSTVQGLSSFAAEMLVIDKMIRLASSSKRILALIDEPARTTNPSEGKALVQAILDELTSLRIISVVTTHYSVPDTGIDRWQVKGLKIDQLPTDLKPTDLTLYMDYTLIKPSGENLPAEGLKVASLLGVNKHLLERAKQYLKQNTQ